MPQARWAHAMVALGGRLWVVGGKIKDTAQTTAILAFDPRTGRWITDLAPVPTLREHVTAVVLGDRVWLIGGRWIRNLPTVEVILADSLNVVDLINADVVLIEQPALARMQEVYA